ncbi:hypothetical protein HETIRDRAFT_322484 [Heterobasidion irregulare TC 32-1]|uniref:Uncharacterized protein n=1 Tax=Heterobasidion irregulare (strain TC 32-1) TaxID=747525 RepID=W4K4G7_HETIT|nr:uncharacterized protein HETIRDRAFT_322484 [Heterobasidion irregulare TC 32-1]ETW79936.1 hypothetical protein HETIRDRAFT_322484 [Heterobasidion irregulare TC 32-1]
MFVHSSSTNLIFSYSRKITPLTDKPTPTIIVSRILTLNSPFPPSLSITMLAAQVTDATDTAKRSKPTRTKRTGKQKPKICASLVVPQINRVCEGAWANDPRRVYEDLAGRGQEHEIGECPACSYNPHHLMFVFAAL